jgi:hypothetical protein
MPSPALSVWRRHPQAVVVLAGVQACRVISRDADADFTACRLSDGYLCGDGHRVAAPVDQNPFQGRSGKVDRGAVASSRVPGMSQGSPAITSIGWWCSGIG